MYNSTFDGQILGDRKCGRHPTKAAVVDFVQIVQIQQARVIFNLLMDIFTKCFSLCFILTDLPPEDLNFVRKELNVIMEDPQTDVLKITVSCERRRVDFPGDSSRRSCKFWIFSGIIPNDERCRSLWVSVALPVYRNFATKRTIVFLSGTLFLPKSLLHCRYVRATDFVTKYASMIFICCCVV